MIKNIGMHRVRHGDVYDDLTELMQNQKADIFYSDPPWGEGNLKYWQTINHKMNGEETKEVNLETFLDRIAEVAYEYTKEDGVVFIEYGYKWNEDLIKVFEAKGFKLQKSIEVLYGSPKRPLIENIFTKGKDLHITDEYIKSVYHTSGFDTLRNAITPFAKPNGIIMDPCCGLGYTAKFAVENNMIFYGNELNKKRLDRTIERLK